AGVRPVPAVRAAGPGGRRHRARLCPDSGAADRRHHQARQRPERGLDLHIDAPSRLDLLRQSTRDAVESTSTMKMNNHQPVTIVMIEDDEGHARLIERNIRRAGVNNEILPFTSGTSAMEYLSSPTGGKHAARGHLVLLDLNLPDIS